MSTYVDGIVIPIPKNKVNSYKKGQARMQNLDEAWGNSLLRMYRRRHKTTLRNSLSTNVQTLKKCFRCL